MRYQLNIGTILIKIDICFCLALFTQYRLKKIYGDSMQERLYHIHHFAFGLKPHLSKRPFTLSPPDPNFLFLVVAIYIANVQIPKL